MFAANPGLSELVAVVADGIIYSSWLFIIAVGLTLIYGVMKILNMAHGSFYALGAYAAASLAGYWLAQGYAPLASYGVLVVAALVVGLVAGPLIERGLLRFMYGKDEIVLLLVTYAVFLILEDVIKLDLGREPLLRRRTVRPARQLRLRRPDLPGVQPRSHRLRYRRRRDARVGASIHAARQAPARRHPRSARSASRWASTSIASTWSRSRSARCSRRSAAR